MQDATQATQTASQGQLPQAASPLMQQLRSSFANSPTITQVAAPVTAVPSDSEKIDVLSAVLDQIEAEAPTVQPIVQQAPQPVPQQVVQPAGTVLDQVLPNVVAATPDPLNPPQPSGSAAKERVVTTDGTAVEVAATMQVVEGEPSPEIPVEVESFIQRVTDHSQTAPTEVVIADGTQEQAAVSYPSRPVIVLPITQQIEDEGIKKSPRFSVRWLIEWSHKIIKMFTGKVIYQQTASQE